VGVGLEKLGNGLHIVSDIVAVFQYLVACVAMVTVVVLAITSVVANKTIPGYVHAIQSAYKRVLRGLVWFWFGLVWFRLGFGLVWFQLGFGLVWFRLSMNWACETQRFRASGTQWHVSILTEYSSSPQANTTYPKCYAALHGFLCCNWPIQLEQAAGAEFVPEPVRVPGHPAIVPGAGGLAAAVHRRGVHNQPRRGRRVCQDG
jgi:hypothetical protein